MTGTLVRVRHDMTEHWAIAAVWAAIVALLALRPSDLLGFLLQALGLGLAVGMFVAYRAQQRNPRREPFPIQVRWGAVGLVAGLVYAFAYALATGVFW